MKKLPINLMKPYVEQMQEPLADDWMDKLPKLKNPKNLRQLADEYPEKAGLQQLAQAWEDGELF